MNTLKLFGVRTVVAIICALIYTTGYSASIDVSSWQVNAWGEVSFDAHTSAACMHEGLSGYYFQLNSRNGGDAEVTLSAVLRPGRAYEFSLWIKSIKGTPQVDARPGAYRRGKRGRRR